MSRLKQVVLPAPLGPISAWMEPRRTQVLSLTAVKPLNSLGQAEVSRMASFALKLFLECCDAPARRNGAALGANCAASYAALERDKWEKYYV